MPTQQEYNSALAEFRKAERMMLNFHDRPETTEAEKQNLIAAYKEALLKVSTLSNQFPNTSPGEILKGFAMQSQLF